MAVFNAGYLLNSTLFDYAMTTRFLFGADWRLIAVYTKEIGFFLQGFGPQLRSVFFCD